MMSGFDTPITTDDQSTEKFMQQPTPTLVLLHNGSKDAIFDDVLSKIAPKNVGELLTVHINSENPESHVRFDLVAIADGISKNLPVTYRSR